jgi:hypothetical protein
MSTKLVMKKSTSKALKSRSQRTTNSSEPSSDVGKPRTVGAAKKIVRGESAVGGSGMAHGTTRRASRGPAAVYPLTGSSKEKEPQMNQVVREALERIDDASKRAVIARSVRAIVAAVEGASTERLGSALAAATDAGSAALILSEAQANSSVNQLDPLFASVLRGGAIKKELVDRAGGLIETADVARHLGISRQAVAKRVQRGTLLALPGPSGSLRFPAMQFAENGTLEGLEKVLGAFNVHSPWTRLAVLLDTDTALGGERVIDALRMGNVDEVLNIVRSFAS